MKKINFILFGIVALMFAFTTNVSAKTTKLTIDIDRESTTDFNIFNEFDKDSKFISSVLLPHTTDMLEYLNGLEPITDYYDAFASAVTTGNDYDNKSIYDTILSYRDRGSKGEYGYAIWLGKSPEHYEITIYVYLPFECRGNSPWDAVLRYRYFFDYDGNFASRGDLEYDYAGESSTHRFDHGHYENLKSSNHGGKYYIDLSYHPENYFNYWDGTMLYYSKDTYLFNYVVYKGQKYHLEKGDGFLTSLSQAWKELWGAHAIGSIDDVKFDFDYYATNKVIGEDFDLEVSKTTLFHLENNFDVTGLDKVNLADNKLGYIFVPIDTDKTDFKNFVIYNSISNHSFYGNAIYMDANEETGSLDLVQGTDVVAFNLLDAFNFSNFPPSSFFIKSPTDGYMRYIYHMFVQDTVNDLYVYYDPYSFSAVKIDASQSKYTSVNIKDKNYSFYIDKDLADKSKTNVSKNSTIFDVDNNGADKVPNNKNNSFDSSIFSKDNVTGLVGNLYVGITGIGTMVTLVLNCFPVELTQFIAFGLASVVIVAVFKFMK